MIRSDHKHGMTLSPSALPPRPNNALASGNIGMAAIGGGIVTVELNLVDVPVSLIHNASGDYGSVKIGSFETQRLVLCLGGTISGLLTCASGVSGAAMETGLGTTAAVAATALALPYDDLVDGVSVNWSASGTLTPVSVSDATLAVSNGTAAVKDIYLNFAGATTVITADAAATFTGKVRFSYVDLGDI